MTHAFDPRQNGGSLDTPIETLAEIGARHRAASATILNVLRIGSEQAFEELAYLLFGLLTPEEILRLARAMLLACKHEGGEDVVGEIFPHLLPAGSPLPALDCRVEQDADLWAEFASTAELFTYPIACFRRLDAKRRANLLKRLQQIQSGGAE